MAKNFNELRRKMSPERRERNAAEAARMLQAMKDHDNKEKTP